MKFIPITFQRLEQIYLAAKDSKNTPKVMRMYHIKCGSKYVLDVYHKKYFDSKKFEKIIRKTENKRGKK